MEVFNNHTIKIITEFEETRDNFIYKTIIPYCKEVTEQKLSKERLKKLLLYGLEKEKEENKNEDWEEEDRKVN